MAARPDFIVIGAMKCATSTVSDYLQRHPDVFMLADHEPRFFSHDEIFAKGTAWYEGLFDARAGEALVGENSNHYAALGLHPETVDRMAAYAPDLRLVFMVRDPIERIVSQWIQNRENHGVRIPATPDRAIGEMPEHFIDQSLYWRTLSRYRERFADERIFVGFMEDMNAEPAAFYARLNAFLGLDDIPPAAPAHRNRSADKRLPSPALDTLRRNPLVRGLKGLAPGALRRRVRDALSPPLAERPRFSPEAYARLAETLRPDAAALLAHCGKPVDFWPTTAGAAAPRREGAAASV